MLTQFIRDENHVPFGVIVAIQDDDGYIRYGVSLKSPKDHWDRDLGRKIAIGRAYTDVMLPEVPQKKERLVLHSLNEMMKRARRYFKDVKHANAYQLALGND